MCERKLNISGRLLRNTVTGWLEMFVLLVSTIIVTPLLIQRLGKEGYGVWMLVGQIVAYLAILDLGVGSSVGRFVSKYEANKDSLGLSRIVNSAIFLFIISSVLICLLTFILCPNFSRFFQLNDKYYGVGRWLILLTGLGVALSFPMRIGQGILEGTHNFHLIYAFRASGSLLKLLLIVLLFGQLERDSLILLAVITVTTTVLPNLLMCWSALNKLPNITIGLRLINIKSLSEIWCLSLSVLLGTIATLLFNQGQIIGVGKMVGPAAATLYAIPVMMLTYASMVAAYMIAAFKPLSSHLQALDQEHSLKKLNINGVSMIFTVTLLIAVLAVVFGGSFLKIWLGSDGLSGQDLNVMNKSLAIMVIGFAAGAPQQVTAKMFSGTDRQWFITVISLGASLAGLLIGILLMAKTNLGLFGMAAGWAAVFVIRGVIILPLSACRHFGIGLISYIEKSYLPPLIAAMILTGAACIIKMRIGAESILSLSLCIALCVIVYAVAVYTLCLDQTQRHQVRGILNGLWT